MKTLSLIVAAMLLGGCATYGDLPALEFRDYDYSGPDGKAWPARDVALPSIAAAHGMGTVPKVHVVELNPDGAKTLVFVHGLGSYLKFWRYNLDHFAAAGYRVVAIDQVGYGKSDKPADFPYTMEAMADVVRAVVKTLELDQPVLVGHSMGGQTVLSYAIRFPADLAGLVLVSPAGFEAFSEREEQWFRQVMSVPLIKGADEAAIWGSVRYNNFSRWTDDYAWLIEERVRAVKNSEFDRYAYANVRSIHGLADNDFVRDNLKHVAAPTLIVYGDEDRLIPSRFLHGGFTADVMQYGADTIPDATLVGLGGCGHTLQMDCTDEFHGAADEWLKSRFVPGPARPRAPVIPPPTLPLTTVTPAVPVEPAAPAVQP